MFDFYEKRRLRRLLFSKPAIAVLVAIALLFAYSVWDLYGIERKAREERQKLEREFNELQEQEARLRTEIERLSTERGIEEEIRRSFDVSKDNERVMVIVDQQEDPADEQTTFGGFWSRILDFVF